MDFFFPMQDSGLEIFTYGFIEFLQNPLRGGAIIIPI